MQINSLLGKGCARGVVMMAAVSLFVATRVSRTWDSSRFKGFMSRYYEICGEF